MDHTSPEALSTEVFPPSLPCGKSSQSTFEIFPPQKKIFAFDLRCRLVVLPWAGYHSESFVFHYRTKQVLEENKDRAKKCGVAGSVVRFVPCSCEPLIVMTLRLLYNLSFDPDIRWLEWGHARGSFRVAPVGKSGARGGWGGVSRAKRGK